MPRRLPESQLGQRRPVGHVVRVRSPQPHRAGRGKLARRYGKAVHRRILACSRTGDHGGHRSRFGREGGVPAGLAHSQLYCARIDAPPDGGGDYFARIYCRARPVVAIQARQALDDRRLRRPHDYRPGYVGILADGDSVLAIADLYRRACNRFSVDGGLAARPFSPASMGKRRWWLAVHGCAGLAVAIVSDQFV